MISSKHQATAGAAGEWPIRLCCRSIGGAQKPEPRHHRLVADLKQHGTLRRRVCMRQPAGDGNHIAVLPPEYR